MDHSLSSVQLPECLAGNEDENEEFSGFTLDSVCGDNMAVETSKSVAEIWRELFGDSEEEEEEFSGFDLHSMYDCYSILHSDSLILFSIIVIHCHHFNPLPGELAHNSLTRMIMTSQKMMNITVSAHIDYNHTDHILILSTVCEDCSELHKGDCPVRGPMLMLDSASGHDEASLQYTTVPVPADLTIRPSNTWSRYWYSGVLERCLIMSRSRV